MLASVTTLCLGLLPGSTLNPRHVQRVQVRAAVVADIEAPKMESSVGFDFVPLLTALQSGQFREADQLTRDGLITIAGEQAQKRGFVYFSEVPKLPKEDLATPRQRPHLSVVLRPPWRLTALLKAHGGARGARTGV